MLNLYRNQTTRQAAYIECFELMEAQGMNYCKIKKHIANFLNEQGFSDNGRDYVHLSGQIFDIHWGIYQELKKKAILDQRRKIANKLDIPLDKIDVGVDGTIIIDPNG